MCQSAKPDASAPPSGRTSPTQDTAIATPARGVASAGVVRPPRPQSAASARTARPNSAGSAHNCARRKLSAESRTSLVSTHAPSACASARSVGGDGVARGSAAPSTIGETIAARRQHQRGYGRGSSGEVTQPSVPRAMRPSSASSSRATAQMQPGSIRVGAIGSTPLQPSIGGGSFTSYSDFGRPMMQPQLDQYQTRGEPDSVEPGACCLKVATSDIQDLIDRAMWQSECDGGVRRHTMCPHMRARGKCGLPSCPYIHEVCRSRKEHRPLTASNPIYNANAPKECKDVPCRFKAALGICPYGEMCRYSHAGPAAPGAGPAPRIPGDALVGSAGATRVGVQAAETDSTRGAAAAEITEGDEQADSSGCDGSSRSSTSSLPPPRKNRTSRPTSAATRNSSRPSSANTRGASGTPRAGRARCRPAFPCPGMGFVGWDTSDRRSRPLSGHGAHHGVLQECRLTRVA